MFDLAARIFYKAHFDIIRERDNIDLLRDVIVDTLADWLKYKHKSKVKYWNWAQFAEYGTFDTDNHEIISKSTTFSEENGSRYWACKIEEFEDSVVDLDGDSSIELKKAPRIWTTEVGFEQKTPEKATISYVVYYTDKAGFVGPLDDVPNYNVPRFVKKLIYCNSKPFYCAIGEYTLSPVPIELQPGTCNSFAEKIKDSHRKVPILLVIPTANDEKGELSHLADLLAKNIMGNALVYKALDSDISEELTYFIERPYWCMPGQIRLYWPESNSATRRNRYLTAEQIDNIGHENIIDIFRRVLATDVRYYESKEMFRIEDCNELYRQSRIRELRSQYNAVCDSVESARLHGSEFEENYKLANQLLEMTEAEKNSLQNELENKKAELEEIKQEFWKIKAYNDHLSSFQEQARGKEKSLENIRNCKSLPNTPLAVAEYFRRVFNDNIDFTDRGIRSVSSCITKPEILWECFYAMSTNLVNLYRSNTPNIENVFREATGCDLARGEGSQTRNNPALMALRKDKYQNRDIIIEPHIRRGNKDNSPDCVRIYFCYDRISSKIVIGHVGNHLDNHTSLSI